MVAGCFATLVPAYQATRRHIQEDYNTTTHCSDNLKSHVLSQDILKEPPTQPVVVKISNCKSVSIQHV